MKQYALLLLLLAGCQINTLDRQVDMKSTINMTFCDGEGVTQFQPAAKQGRPVSFKCRNGMSATLPNQTIFESDDSYLSKYYDQFLMLKFSRCPDETDKVRWFNIEISKKRQRYSMACTKSGRFMVEASYFDDIEKQSETTFDLESYCESEPFQLINITRKSPLKQTYKFKCGEAKYTLGNNITPDDIYSLNALYCDYSGFQSITAKQTNSISNTKQATFRCNNGFRTTTKF